MQMSDMLFVGLASSPLLLSVAEHGEPSTSSSMHSEHNATTRP